MNILAIDLGTGNIDLATLDGTGNPVVMPDRWGDPSTPAYIFLDGARVVFGSEARNARFQNPQRYISEWKRFMGTDTVLATADDGTEYRARDCARLFIAEAKHAYEKKTGEVLQCVVIGIPANYDQRQRQETKEAAEVLGLEVLQLVHEPTAAALGNKVQDRSDGKRLVADLGHGTFDVNVVSKSGNNLDVQGTRGVPKLGGSDFTQRLLAHATAQFEAEHGIKLDPDTHPLAYQDLQQRAEQAKHTLTRVSTATIVVTCDGKMSSVSVTREQFKTMCADLLKCAMICVDEVLKECRLNAGDFEEVLAVGGGAQMPMFREALEERMGMAPTEHCEPNYAVALGCAVAGRMELDRQGRSPVINGMRLPPINLFTRDATPNEFGVTVLTDDRAHEVLAVVLKRNRPIPCDHTCAFQLAESDQTDARIELLEGTAGALRADCRILGYFDLVGLTPVRGAPHRIDIRMRIDRNGMLNTSAQDTLSGKEADLTVDYRNVAAPVVSGQAAGAP